MSLPNAQSASFGGAGAGLSDFDLFGNHLGSSTKVPAGFYDSIASDNNQGLDGSDAVDTHKKAINLMANSDVTMPDEWKTYRQQLRDFPASPKINPQLKDDGTLNMTSVSWPTKPS